MEHCGIDSLNFNKRKFDMDCDPEEIPLSPASCSGASSCTAALVWAGDGDDSADAAACNRKAPRTQRTATASAAILDLLSGAGGFHGDQSVQPTLSSTLPPSSASIACGACEGPSPWHDLPDDVLRRVLDHLPSHYLRVARLVCCGWHRSIGRTLVHLTPESLEGVALRFSNLRALDLSCCETEVEVTGLGALRLGSALADASLGHLAGLRRLEELTLRGCTRLEGPGLALLMHLPMLRTLDLAGCTGLTDIGLQAGLAALPQLTSVRLLGCLGLTDGCSTGLVALPNLQRLAVPPKITDAGLAALAAAPLLERVAIRGCRGVGPEGIAALLQAPCLQRVVVSRCVLVTATALGGVAPNLRVVTCPLPPPLPLDSHRPGAGSYVAAASPDMQLLMANLNN